MQGHRFEEEDTGRFAITGDRGGLHLPRLGCVWRIVGPVEIDAPEVRMGLKPAIIKEAILKKGYFLWPDDADGAD